MRKPISKDRVKNIVTRAVEGSELLMYARDFLSTSIEELEKELIDELCERLNNSMEKD